MGSYSPPESRQKKKILVLVDWFTPGYKAGGPIQSCANFAFSLREEFEIYVLTTDTDHGEAKPYPDIETGRWLTNLHPGFRVKYLPKATLKPGLIRKEIRESGADFVYLNHLFSPLFVVYPLWLKYMGSFKSRIVLCPRGALYDSALSVKRWKKTPFIRLFRWLGFHRFITFHATNAREKAAILDFFPGSTVRIADNLPKSDQPAFQTRPKQPGKLKAVFVARVIPIKNLSFLLTALEKARADVELSVIGPVEDAAYWASCQRQIERLPANIAVTYLGPRRNDELMPILQDNHLFILPTTGENFGHSIFEAMVAGRPVLISDQTPWLGLTQQKVGWDLPLDSADGFTAAIGEAAAWDQARFDEWAKNAWNYASHFINNPELHRQYLQLFT